MAPPPPAAPPIRVDRPAEYPIRLGSSLQDSDPSSYASLKYNFKPNSSVHNPSSPLLKPSSNDSGYSLTFTPASGSKIQYNGTATTPSARRQHFLLFDPSTKSFTLEKLDSAFVFNAEVFANLHAPLPAETASSDDEGSDNDDSGDAIYDYRNFLGRKKKKAAEEKQAKRLEALKRAGRQVVEVEDPVEETPAPIPTPRVETDSELDAVGESEELESEDEGLHHHYPPPPPPPPPPPAKPAPTQRKAKKPPPPPPPADDGEMELVLPDPVIPVPTHTHDDGDDEIEFSDEDADEDDDEDLLDIGKELEEALESGAEELVIEEEQHPSSLNPRAPVPAPRSLAGMFGATAVEDDDSESEEE